MKDEKRKHVLRTCEMLVKYPHAPNGAFSPFIFHTPANAGVFIFFSPHFYIDIIISIH